MTADFFPPIVDDPYLFGAVAAANALSDVYAMGGEAMLAINLVGWPSEVDASVLVSVLGGGAEKVNEAGALLVGGHTVMDTEPKYGLAVSGMVKPEQMLRKGGARPGDALVLTKPLGSGTITTAIKRGEAADGDVEACIDIMTALNRNAMLAAQAMHPYVHAATDVSGFGLIGHAHEMATQSGCTLRVEWERLPWMRGAIHHARQECFADGAIRNSEFYSSWTGYDLELAGWQRLLLCDPQTSGGLLLAVASECVSELVLELKKRGQVGYIIGEAVPDMAVQVLFC